MKKEVFLAKVKEEANRLKNSLSDAQKAMIDYDKLKPSTSDSCLLGQVFGRHDSEESIAVLPKSIFTRISVDFFEAIFMNDLRRPNFKFENVEFFDVESHDVKPSTYLEIFLMCNTNTEDLIKFVKGEVETFEPEFNEVAEEVEL